MTIGLQVFKARDAAGLTQKQLADRLGMKKQSISDIECERRAISLKMLKRVATELGEPIVIYPDTGHSPREGRDMSELQKELVALIQDDTAATIQAVSEMRRDLNAMSEEVAKIRAQHAAQVAALTEQRDALLAACKAAHGWCDAELMIGPSRGSVLDLLCRLADAIAQGEAKE